MRVVTVKALAEYMQCNSSTIYRLLKRNEIPAFKIGSDWRFDLDAVDRWVLQKQVHSTTERTSPDARRWQLTLCNSF